MRFVSKENLSNILQAFANKFLDIHTYKGEHDGSVKCADTLANLTTSTSTLNNISESADGILLYNGKAYVPLEKYNSDIEDMTKKISDINKSISIRKV